MVMGLSGFADLLVVVGREPLHLASRGMEESRRTGKGLGVTVCLNKSSGHGIL